MEAKMNSAVRKTTFAFLFGWAAVTVVGNAHAQTAVADRMRERLAAAVQKIQAGCAADLAKFCSDVTPGEGRVIFCMMAHEDKISTKCDYTLYSAARNISRALDLIEQAADVCWPDIEKYCANIPEGGGRIAQCLIDKKNMLGHDCQIAIEQVPDVNR
jgi:Cysteine rich repeat